MKLALVFSGQPRCFDDKAYMANKFFFLDEHQCDVYAHFWFSEDSSTTYETAPYSGLGTLTFPSDTIQKFCSLYSPKKIVYEPPLPKSVVKRTYTNTPQPSVPYNIISKYTSLQKAFELIETIDQYDFIINLRSDTVIYYMPDLNTFDRTKIYMTALGGCQERMIQHDFHIVPPKFAHHFYNSISMLDTWYDQGCMFLGEEFILKLLEEYKLRPHLCLMSFSSFNMALQRSKDKLIVCRDRE